VVMQHQEDQALLKAYISSWKKFFSQCSYLPMPFHQLEQALLNKPPTNSTQKKGNNDESIVRKLTFSNNIGKFDLDVTTFQMAVLFVWNDRPFDKISYENLRLATELPDPELRKTLWSLIAFPKLKRQVLVCESDVKSVKDFDDSTLFAINQEFSVIKNGKSQRRGKVNLIGRLQLATEKCREEDNESIVRLRILRTQEAIVTIMKMRKTMTNAQLQTELVEILKNMFLPSKKMIKEQIEWLIEHRYMRRDDDNIGLFIYMA
ncbi:unnamed protein product, partial [Oppiella nova]